jgi:phage terminase large subunit-like protein
MWNFSCPDWVERLKAGRSLLPELPLNLTEAARAVSIFNKLRLPDVPGQPRLGEAAGEWQRDIVRAIFGSLIDGQRMVPEVLPLVPKKNSKTTGGAAIMMTALLMNVRPRAEFVLVGPTQEVADLAFQQCAGMIDADPEGYLQTRYQVQEHLKTIVDRRNKAKLKIKTFDLKVATGSKPAGILIDELHLMSQMSFATRVIGQLRGGVIANPEAFLIMITTQSDEAPAGVFKAELSYARAIRDGRVAGKHRVLPMLYEFPEQMQTDEAMPWADPKNWPMVLPNLGKSIAIDRLIDDFDTAKMKGDEEIRRWASQHLNVEIGLALHDGRWRGADYWLNAKDPQQITLESLIERSEVIVVGGDAGGLDDMLALSVIGRDRATKDWLQWSHAWVQDDVVEKRKEIAERLLDFVKDGDLTVNTDAKQDVKEFCDIIEMLWLTGKVPDRYGVGLDPASITTIVDELDARGIKTDEHEGPVVGAKQSALALSPSIWGLERKLKDGTFWHAGQPMMAWCVSNAKAEQRGNAVLITKQTAGKAKIDPLVATFNAVMLMSRNPEAEGPSIYNTRGILVL